MRAGALDGGTLRLDGTDGLEYVVSGSNHDELMLPVQQREHFTILLQFFAQGANQMLDMFNHESRF
jgi:hypothetical protein